MYPKSFIQFHQEGKKILGVQVRCLPTDRTQTGEKQTDLILEATPPDLGHLKSNHNLNSFNNAKIK